MYTVFADMHSGGSKKEPTECIIIEAPEGEAVSIFYARFGHNPHRVTCTCCGPDYSVWECGTLDEALTWDWRTNNMLIEANQIKEWERHVHVPERDYVWAGD